MDDSPAHHWEIGDRVVRGSGELRTMTPARRILVLASLCVLALCAVPRIAYALSGEACSKTPTPAFSPKALISDLRILERMNLDRPEARACMYYGIGLLQAFMKQNEDAIAAYDHAVKTIDNFADAYEARGDAYADLGMQDEAQADYAKAAELSKDQPEAINSRCWQRAIRGRALDRALIDCNEAVAADPRSWHYLDSRCLVNFRLGNYAAAISDCDEALKYRSSLPSSLFIRGLAKLRAGDLANGNADVATAKEQDYRIGEEYAVFGVKP